MKLKNRLEIKVEYSKNLKDFLLKYNIKEIITMKNKNIIPLIMNPWKRLLIPIIDTTGKVI